jgi:hypothetical protein
MVGDYAIQAFWAIVGLLALYLLMVLRRYYKYPTDEERLGVYTLIDQKTGLMVKGRLSRADRLVTWDRLQLLKRLGRNPPLEFEQAVLKKWRFYAMNVMDFAQHVRLQGYRLLIASTADLGDPRNYVTVARRLDIIPPELYDEKVAIFRAAERFRSPNPKADEVLIVEPLPRQHKPGEDRISEAYLAMDREALAHFVAAVDLAARNTGRIKELEARLRVLESELQAERAGRTEDAAALQAALRAASTPPLSGGPQPSVRLTGLRREGLVEGLGVIVMGAVAGFYLLGYYTIPLEFLQQYPWLGGLLTEMFGKTLAGMLISALLYAWWTRRRR